MKYSFDDIFQEFSNGMIGPKFPVRIGGVTMGPGATFGSGASMGGVNLHQMRGKDIEGDHDGGVFVIKGFYN